MLHPAQATADDGGKHVNSQMVGKCRLGIYPVFYDDVGEIGAIGLTRAWVGTARAGTAMTPAQVVNAHNEESIRVDGLARTDTGIPPAWFCIVLVMKSSCVVMTG